MLPSSPNDAPGPQRQLEIYKWGVLGKTPSQAIAFEELEQQARKKLKKEVFAYLAGGAGSEDTVRVNREAFGRWRIVPRVLRNVAQRDLGVEICGRRFPVPIFLAPVGVLGIVHKKGELAVARAARSLDVPLILSNLCSFTLEEVAEAMGPATRWFQLYWPANHDLAVSFVERAERAGYAAIVVTLDTFLFGWRERDLQNAYFPFSRGQGLANYYSDPVFRSGLGGDPKWHPIKAVEHFRSIFFNPALTWNDLGFLRQRTRLPILLKGILHPDDGRKAVDHGMDGIIVSNHGGRQLNGAVAALDALPHVADAVRDQVPILFDSGIRGGSDVLKAIALGAKSVLLGRPYCYGLAVNGEEGVRDVLQNLIADIDLALGLTGCASLAELGRECLTQSPA